MEKSNPKAPEAASSVTPEGTLGTEGASLLPPGTAQLMGLQASANGSQRVSQLQQYQLVANQGASLAPPTQRKPNATGLPDQLKSGVEQLSGQNLDDVQVHYNSPKPAQLQAHAYAQGNQIHLASGQERHLPHETWHVAQQKQGRVQPTRQLKAAVPINDDAGLEQEADVMGQKALQMAPNPIIQQASRQLVSPDLPYQRRSTLAPLPTLQRVEDGDSLHEEESTLDKALKSGQASGSLSTDLLVKVIKSQLHTPSKQELIYGVLHAFDSGFQQLKEAGKQRLLSWLYNQLTGAWATWLMGWAQLAYQAMGVAQTVFRMLPEAVQTMIIFVMARGLRRMLGYVISPAWAESTVEFLFVTDPQSAWATISEWVEGLMNRPATFLYEKARDYLGSEESQNEDQQDQQDQPKQDTGKKSGINANIDSLFNLDTSILKLQVGRPQLAKGQEAANQRAKQPGGLKMPFAFSLHLFGRDLKATDVNTLTIPWDRGFDLMIPSTTLQIDAKLANVFSLQTLAIKDLHITEEGLKSVEINLEGLSFANDTVNFDKLGGSWIKDKGTQFKADGTINALNNKFPIKIGLGLAADGSFKGASLEVSSPGVFTVIPDTLTIGSPKFSGSVEKGGIVHLKFSGNPALTIAGMKLLEAEEMYVAYNHTEDGHDFSLGATTLTLQYGKLSLVLVNPSLSKDGLHLAQATMKFGNTEESAEKESDFLKKSSTDKSFDWLDLLKVTPEAEFSVPNIHIQRTDPKFSMGKPSVAKISLSMLGIKTMLDFKNKQGSLAGHIGYQPTIPTFSLPIPIVPGVEAYVDFAIEPSLGAGVEGTLNKPKADQPPWHAAGKASVNASVAAILSAGVNLGSQLVAALSAGLYAKGQGDFEGEFGISGGLQFAKNKIESVPTDKLRIQYKVGPVITASVGLELKVKALHVFQKKLYQREFKKWTIGKYQLEGDMQWDGTKWHTPKPKGKFANEKIAAPTHTDKLVGPEESRKLLLGAGVAIANGAELRKEQVNAIIEEYLAKDQEVYNQLDLYSHELVNLKNDRLQLKKRILSSLRFRKELSQLKKDIAITAEKVETLHQNYREILLVLVDVRQVINAISKNELDLGGGNLNEQLERVYHTNAERDDEQVEFVRGSMRQSKRKIRTLQEERTDA